MICSLIVWFHTDFNRRKITTNGELTLARRILKILL